MNPRGPRQGMINILRFNRNLYLAAAVVFLAALAGLVRFDPPLLKLACAAAHAAGCALYHFFDMSTDTVLSPPRRSCHALRVSPLGLAPVTRKKKVAPAE